jgi:hypothetical protein
LCRLENGNTLTIASIYREISKVLPRVVIDGVILEIDRNGEIVWEWSALEHFEQLGLTSEQKDLLKKKKGLIDIFHANSIQVLPRNMHESYDARFNAGNILVSHRSTCGLIIIDRTNGDVVWSMVGETIAQHHASMIPNGLPGEGNILIFDNGGTVTLSAKFRPYSIVKEINPLNITTQWKYEALDNRKAPDTFFSLVRSSAQRLPNGNTLIVESTFGRVFEVDGHKNIVWEYISPYFREDSTDRRSNQIYRAYRVSNTWPTGSVSTGQDVFVW